MSRTNDSENPFKERFVEIDKRMDVSADGKTVTDYATKKTFPVSYNFAGTEVEKELNKKVDDIMRFCDEHCLPFSLLVQIQQSEEGAGIVHRASLPGRRVGVMLRVMDDVVRLSRNDKFAMLLFSLVATARTSLGFDKNDCDKEGNEKE